jgi:hypothetical protein
MSGKRAWQGRLCSGRDGLTLFGIPFEPFSNSLALDSALSGAGGAGRIVSTCGLFSLIPGECLKPETAWRSAVISNSQATSHMG